MKASEQYFPVVLFIMLHKVVGVKSLSMTICISMKTVVKYFPVLLFIKSYVGKIDFN